MFKVTLGSGKTFDATAVNENLDVRKGEERVRSLSIECTPTDKSLEYYEGLFTEAGALDQIAVALADGTAAMTAAGYGAIQSMQVRLLTTGERAMNVQLIPAAAAEE